MILTVFELITMSALLGLAFLLGRIIWEIRQQEILFRDHERAGFRLSTAHIPPSCPPVEVCIGAVSASLLMDREPSLSFVPSPFPHLVEPQR